MTLTRGELNILGQLIQDKSEQEIAVALNMEEAQVKRFLELLMKKYRVDSLSALKVIGRQHFPDTRSK
jgi:FixJ family two-component response regulator